MLLVYGARIMPPRNGNPGIRVTVAADGACLLEPVGYPDRQSAHAAAISAGQTCVDADLLVSSVPGRPLAWTVRRRP